VGAAGPEGVPCHAGTHVAPPLLRGGGDVEPLLLLLGQAFRFLGSGGALAAIQERKAGWWLIFFFHLINLT